MIFNWSLSVYFQLFYFNTVCLYAHIILCGIINIIFQQITLEILNAYYNIKSSERSSVKTTEPF